LSVYLNDQEQLRHDLYDVSRLENKVPLSLFALGREAAGDVGGGVADRVVELLVVVGGKFATRTRLKTF
jgi:hypothetical protein